MVQVDKDLRHGCASMVYWCFHVPANCTRVTMVVQLLMIRDVMSNLCG